MTKGEPIRFTGGKYVGKTGWINTAKGENGFTEEKVYVYVDRSKGKKPKPDLATHVNQEFIAPKDLPTPQSYEEAAFQQHPKIEREMNKLTKKLAMLGINSEDEFTQMFGNKLQAAINSQKESPGAMYYHVEFDQPTYDEPDDDL